MPRSSSSRAACCMISMSLLEPITMPTRGASTSMSSSCDSTSGSFISSGTSEISGAPPGRPSRADGPSCPPSLSRCGYTRTRASRASARTGKVPSLEVIQTPAYAARRWNPACARRLQRSDELLDRDCGERLVAPRAARAQLERDACHRPLVRGFDNRDEVDMTEGRPLGLYGRSKLLDLLV